MSPSCPKQSQGSQKGAAAAAMLSAEELRVNGVQHVLVSQQNKQPIKRAELLKSLNHQSKDFKQAVQDIGHSLNIVFGIKLIGIRMVENVGFAECGLEGAAQYLVISDVTKLPVPILNLATPKKEILKGTAIKVILSYLYMSRSNGKPEVDEASLWGFLQEAELAGKICDRQEDFKKFLKTEMVDSLYANRLDFKSTEGTKTYKYSWGIRAELECDKYEILKSIAKMSSKPIESFTKNFTELKRDPHYKGKIARDLKIQLSRQEEEEDDGDVTESDGEGEDLHELSVTQDQQN